MEPYGDKVEEEDEVKVKVEEFDPRVYYVQQQNCTTTKQQEFATHSSHQQPSSPIKLTTKAGTSGKEQTNSSYGRVAERNNNFGNSSNATFKDEKESEESVLGMPNEAYPEDTCAHCGKIFPGPISVRTHQIVHRIVPPKTKICCCGERFHLRSGLENHMRICRTTEILKQQQQQQQQELELHNSSTYYTPTRTSPPKPAPAPQPTPPAHVPTKQNLISIVTSCPNCGNGAVALADIHAEPITFHCSQCGQEIKNVMFVRILQDGAADANASGGRESAGVTLPIKQEVSYIISDSANHGC